MLRRATTSTALSSRALVGAAYSTSAKASSSHAVADDAPAPTSTPAPSTQSFFKRTFADMYTDMLPPRQFDRRNRLREELERRDQLARRVVLDIPEFYVGSIVAVTQADKYAPSRTTRFVGICIARQHTGLKHSFLLRNVVDGLGVQILYNMYNPLIQSIEVLKLMKHRDTEMFYLKDAPPEYSTFPQNMAAVPHPPGADIPENPLKVRLRPPPWSQNWHVKQYHGIDSESIWSQTTPWYKRKFYRQATHPDREYDIVAHMREENVPREDEQQAHEDMHAFAASVPGLNETLRKARRRHLFAPLHAAEANKAKK